MLYLSETLPVQRGSSLAGRSPAPAPPLVFEPVRARISSQALSFTSAGGSFRSWGAVATKVRREIAQQLALLEELKAAAEKLGLQVREERLLREVGYRVRSGSCRVGAQQLIFLDRDLPVSGQIEVLVEELSARGLEAIYLSPAARTLIEGAATRGALLNGGTEARGR